MANVIDDTTPSQIDEIDGGYVADGDELDDVVLDEEQSVYRKRIVKVINGKMVAQKIIYIQLLERSASGGYGDAYVCLRPNVDSSTGKITSFTPISIDEL